MSRNPLLSCFALIVTFNCLITVQAAEFVPIREYRDRGDTPFPDFGIGNNLIIESLDAGFVSQPGLTVSTSNLSFIREGFSVRPDIPGGQGFAFEALPSSCVTSFPPQCPATVTLEFDDSAFDQLPTYVGFVWTDAVRGLPEDIHPWARVNVTDVNGDVSENLINQLPLARELEDEFADDTLISFVNDAGIQKLDLTVVTNGNGLGGHLAIDHIQYGVAALSGDADVDGDVDFRDFTILANEFGKDGTSWQQADFDFNKKTEFKDFLMLAQNFGLAREIPPLSRRDRADVSTIPEPSSGWLSIVAVSCLLLLRRRGR